MRDFFKSPVVHSILAFLALILLALAVWFIGPLLSFGELHPLAGAGIRIAVILLSLVLVVFALLGWNLSVIGVAALCLLIWNAGPLFAFNGAQPLAPVWSRALIIGLILLIYAIWGIYQLWTLIRNNEALAQKLFSRDKSGAPSLARDEVRAINGIAQNAIAQLKQMHMTMAGGTGMAVSGLRRLIEGKRYLYELPWYMLIGGSGVGKTSLLMNSGLNFPVADQMGAASAHMTLTQDTGTTNCAWWFTNEAVLIDTAGRYTKPDDGQSRAVNTATQEASKDASEITAAATARKDLNHAEWLGFLGVLRKVRARAPINGAMLAIDVEQLLNFNDEQRISHAAQLRARLGELRQQLGIRFPVYVVLTKTDRLRGFVEYFASLTTEARAQVWGFTLPWQESRTGFAQNFAKRSGARSTDQQAIESAVSTIATSTGPLSKRVHQEMIALRQRIADGVATRLQEEFDEDRRQALYLLPHEFGALTPALVQLLDATFSDSRFDTTQLTHTLRGVYLTSAMQHEGMVVTADKKALVPRLLDGLSKLKGLGSRQGNKKPSLPSSTRSYFVNDALSRVMIPEAHLVKPNLRWEARFRLLHLLGHALVLILFFWIMSGLLLSYKNNREYLRDVRDKTAALTTQVKQLYVRMDTSRVSSVLAAAQALPKHQGLDLANPASSYLYGLYGGDSILHSAGAAYGQLQDRLVLPVILRRMEYVMRDSVITGNSKKALTTLRAYLLLHDLPKYQENPQAAARDLRAWALQDWQDRGNDNTELAASSDEDSMPSAQNERFGNALQDEAGSASVDPGPDDPDAVPNLADSFNNASSMIGYLEDMFSGQRIVQSATGRNEGLVRQVRSYLDSSSSTERLYDRVKAAMLDDAPQDFTLMRALGPQAGTLFTRASEKSLEKGVPGIFTHDGYHKLFVRRLPELIAIAYRDDQWVMGRNSSGDESVLQKESAPSLDIDKEELNAVSEDVRRQYLNEYTERWTDFLEDIRVIRSDQGSGNLTFELDLLRRLAAPDSPLARLGRMAARETTLSRSLNANSGEDSKSIFDKASDRLQQKEASAGQDLGLHPEQEMERRLVDDRFGALREVVIGQGDSAAPNPAAKPALDSITGLLNEYYTVLVVADTALSGGTLPPSGVEVETKLKIEAGKLPAPFREVLLGVSVGGLGKVKLGTAAILRTQAQVQLDRLVSLMDLQVTAPCQRSLEGRYPFADSQQEASIDDFNAMFAAGGPADDYFNKNLLPFVDTSARPWRYKSTAAINTVGVDPLAYGYAPTAGSNPSITSELLKLLSRNGPNPEAFAKMAQIREAFFRDPGAKRMSWKLDAQILSLDPTVTELVMDFDGQTQRYAHGPMQTFSLLWPGPRGGTMSEISAAPRIRPDTSTISMTGPWALLHLFERGKIINSANAGSVDVDFDFDDRHAVFEINSSGVNPLATSLLKNFSCPTRLGGA